MSAPTADLLVELGTEELPPKALRTLSDAFSAGIADGLKTALLQRDAEHPTGTVTVRTGRPSASDASVTPCSLNTAVTKSGTRVS